MDDNQEDVLEQAVQRFVDAQLSGQEPEVDAFARQHPHCEEQLKKRLQSLQRVDALLTDLTRADASDFEETAPGQDLVGQKVWSFEIVEMIGRGGMGVVYLARDTKLKRSVAIKSMPDELQVDPTARTRFRREAELLASLNHPNIAVIHEILEEEKSGYLILEYIPGETLAERIAREPLKLEEALSIGQQVAEAVSAAHDKGVIHRDLKPGNIKITPEGKVKVLDFGLAKATSRQGENEETTVTQPGRVIGTPAYMSPEQARGKPADKRSDIWSFGCVMYQMLTGQLPFEGETATDTVARILEREPDWEALPQETPTNIRTLLRRCLEKKPQRRLQHIGDAVIEITETLNMPVTAPPVTTPSSTSRKPQITAGRKLRTAAMIVIAAFVIVLSVIAVQLVSKKAVQPSLKEIRLVVLPFENLGSTEDEYFADGITDAITARLAGIHGLGVISRQSAIEYKKRERDTRQIAEELRVDYILEGTVQRERPTDPTSRVRIIPQLINASEDAHVWTEIYDEDMSEVFRLQSDIAERVAQALDIALIEPERRALSSRPTRNMEAYEYYLRGDEYFHRNELGIALRMYEKAIEMDPTFAVAYAKLSEVHTSMCLSNRDRSEEHLAKAKQAVDKAFQLDSDLPEAHLALGRHYDCCLDDNRALEQYTIAQKSQPNNNEVIARIGYVQRRQGKFEQAVANFKKVWELDPLSYGLPGQLGETYVRLRKYSEAERYFNRAISLAPDLPVPYFNKAWLYLYWEGSTEKAWAVLAEALQDIESTQEFMSRLLVSLHVFDRNYQEALDSLSLRPMDIDERARLIPKSLQYAQINMYMDKKELAKEYYDEARSILESKIKEQPEDERFHSSLGMVYAGLGRKEEAVREGKLAVEMLPVSKDAMRGPDRLENLARIYVMVGEFDAAIDQLEFLLSIPDDTSIPLFRLDPAWDPLRNHPRFQKLLRAAK